MGSQSGGLMWQQNEIKQRWRLARKIVGNYMQVTDKPGPHIWVTASFDTPELAELCALSGVEVVPADVFAVRKQHLNAIRVSLTASKSRVEIKIALETIANLLHQYSSR